MLNLETYHFYTYYREKLTSEVIISSDRKSVIYKRYSSDVVEVPYLFDNPTVEQMYDFLESRCMPRGRRQIGDYLKSLGLEEYNPYEIVKITHGVMWEDFLWIKFPDEEITWDEVKIRD